MYSDPPPNSGQGFYQNSYQSPPKKSGPGCWLWVPLGCFVVAFFLIVFFVLVVHTAIHSGNKNMMKSMGGGNLLQGGVYVAEAKEKMKNINTQVNMYHWATGHYPATLQTLVPQYIPDGKTLHLMTDPDTSPTHISFTYTKPADNSPKNIPYLNTHVNYTFSMLGTNQQVKIVLNASLDGKIDEERHQTSN